VGLSVLTIVNIVMFKYLNMYQHSMVFKTITVTVPAYEALKSLKTDSESFSDLALRLAKRRKLSDFFGVISKEAGESMEKVIMDRRKVTRDLHVKRMKMISEAMK